MNIENNDTPVETIDTESTEQSLDDFEAEFFSGKAPVEKPVEEVEEDDSSEDTEETTEETVEDDASDDSDDTVDEEDDSEETPKKETRAEKRIRELNAKFREEERKRLELERRLEERNKSEEKPNNEQKPNVEADAAPHWDDEDENGNKKYPLGQFDPKFNADLVRYTVQQEQKQFEERQKQAEMQRRQQEAEMALQEQWQEKLTSAQERYPDFMEKGQELVDGFSDLDPNYGKYLTDTIRSIDNGPEVLYYLASNPDVAREIVNQGAAKATLALGRISAQFEDEAPKKTTARTKLTSAPPPPPTAKGRALPKTKDLDNLDDFEDVFFKRK